MRLAASLSLSLVADSSKIGLNLDQAAIGAPGRAQQQERQPSSQRARRRRPTGKTREEADKASALATCQAGWRTIN